MITKLEHKLEYYRRLDELSARRYLGLLALDLICTESKRSVNPLVIMPTLFVKVKGSSRTSILNRGGGIRKQAAVEKKLTKHPEIITVFQMVTEDSVASLPQVANTKWTHLKPQAIADRTTTFILLRWSTCNIRYL